MLYLNVSDHVTDCRINIDIKTEGFGRAFQHLGEPGGSGAVGAVDLRVDGHVVESEKRAMTS